jgi:putative ABC transport system permease protein
MNLRDGWQRLRAVFDRTAMEEEIAEEVSYHIERETERLLAEGVPASEARRRARVAFGGVDRYVEAAREEHRSRWLEDVIADVRVALRSLRDGPAFAAVAVLSLAVGIGGNAAIFSVVNAVLLRPLPYESPASLVQVSTRNENQEFGSSLSVADVMALDTTRSFAAFGAWGEQQGGFAAVVKGETESVGGAQATAGLFRALGVAPLLGRVFVDEDHDAAAERVVLLSHGYWQDRFGGRADVLGQVLRLDDQPYTIVGVMPPGFEVPPARGHRVWVAPPVTRPEWRAPFWLVGVARLRSGVSGEAATAELAQVRQRVLEEYPGVSSGWRYEVVPLKENMVREARLTLFVLLGAVGLVLVIATANVANLLLARATTRAPEIAVRSALGAGRGRLARQLLTESLLLGVLGGAFGLALGWIGVRLLPALVPGNLPRRDEIALDMRVLLFVLAVSLIAGLIIGVLPALRASRADLVTRLREGGRSGSTARAGRVRAGLVVLEFALAVAVVVGAGLVVNSLSRLQRVDAGVDIERLLTVRIAIPRARYEAPEQVAGFFDPLVEQVRALPGVRSAAVSMAVPPHRLVMRNPFTPEGKVYAPGEQAPVAAELLVGDGFFETLGIVPTRGRVFDERDGLGAPPVVIIDETLARTYFPGVDPIGRWLTTGDPAPDATRITIVGVVPDVKYAGLDAPAEPTLYVPYAQNRWWRSMYLIVRTQGAPLALAPAVRARVAELDPNVPLREITTVERLATESVAGPRFRAFLLAAFGAVALLLACAGIYGVLAYDVARRRRETGIRIAVGAGRRTIVGEIVRRGMRLAALGILLGCLSAAAVTRLLEGLLFEVDPLDPATFAAAVAILGVVGAAACAIPALRAARTDPMIALRTE